MKSRRLIVLLSVLAFCTLVIVLSSTLFTMKSASVNWLSNRNMLVELDENTILNSADIPYGNSIFLVDKDEIIADIEKANPYLRVVSIETKFPNKLVLHTVERMPFFGIKISDGRYALVDDMCKVLEIVGESYFTAISESTDGYEYDAPVKVMIEDYTVPQEAYVVGEVLHSDMVVDIVKTMAYSLKESGYSATMCGGMFDEILIKKTGNNIVTTFYTDYGLEIKIDDTANYTTDKIIQGLCHYNELHDDSIVDGTIYVWYHEGLGKPVSTDNARLGQ